MSIIEYVSKSRLKYVGVLVVAAVFFPREIQVFLVGVATGIMGAPYLMGIDVWLLEDKQ